MTAVKDVEYARANEAERACWAAWERAGKPHPDHTGAVAQAVVIAERYHHQKPTTEELTDAAIRSLELRK